MLPGHAINKKLTGLSLAWIVIAVIAVPMFAWLSFETWYGAVYVLLGFAFGYYAWKLDGFVLSKVFFAIGLIIAIPVYSATVFAEINSVKIWGQDDEIPDYVRSQGIMVVELNVTIPGDTNISKEQIALQIGSETMYFSQCELSNATDMCQMAANGSYALCGCINMLGSEQNPLTQSSYNMQFLVFTDNNLYNPYDTEIKKIYVDNQDPYVNIAELTQIQNNLQLKLTAHDPGSTICGGLDRIEFYKDATLLSGSTITLNQKPGNCSSTGQYQKYINITLTGSGNQTFYATAYDNLGNAKNSSSESKIVDISPPSITTNFKVFQAGQEISYMATQGPTAGLRATSLELEITDHELDYLFARVSSLNDNIIYKDRYKLLNITNPDSVCTKDGEVYKCRFSKLQTGNIYAEDIFIHLPTGNLAFNVTAVDKQGFVTVKQVTNTMLVDNTRPEVQKLGTLKCNEDDCYVNPGANTFIANIDDAEAGFDHSLVFLDASAIMTSGGQMQMWCTYDSIWKCLNTVNVAGLTMGQGYRVTLLPISQDDAGNPVAGMTQRLIYFDDQAPVIDPDRSRLEAQKPDGSRLPYIESGDSLIIQIAGEDEGAGVVKEDGTWNVDIDMTDLLDESEETWVTADYCEDWDNDTFACKWELLGPLVDGPLSQPAGLNVRVRDVAGNTEEKLMFANFTIFDPVQSSPGDVWTAKDVNCMPEFLDRSLVRYYPGGNKIWCEFNLQAAANYVMLSIQPYAECTPADDDSADYFDKSELFGDELVTAQGSANPTLYTIVSFDAQTIEPQVSKIKIYCPYQILYAHKVQRRIYEPEIENITITIDVKNGNAALDTTLHNQVDELKDSLKGSQWIDDVSDIFETLSTICRLLNYLVTVIDILTGVFGALDWIPIWNAKQAVGTAGEAANTGKNGVYEAIMVACYVIECKINPLEAVGVDFPFGEWVSGYVELTAGDFSKLWNVEEGGTGEQFAQSLANDFSSSNPKDSLILSALMLCIPGVLYNLKKARQIDCYYVLCMEKMVPLGTPVFACKSTRALMWCRYVVGQITSLIPFIELIKNFGSLIEGLLSDPMALIGFIVGVACGVSWIAGFLGIASICEYPLAAAQLLAIGESLSTEFDSSYKGTDFCKEALAE